MSKNEIIDKILELKMKKKQTQKDKLQIQKLQQQLIELKINKLYIVSLDWDTDSVQSVLDVVNKVGLPDYTI